MNTIIKLFIGLFFVIFAITASAETVTIDGLKYDLNSDATASVAQQDQTIAGEIMIPSTVEYGGLTYQVAEVGEKAFYNCTKITSVTISSGVTTLENECFQYCENLLEVFLPSTVLTLGHSCFASCNSLNSIIIPESVTSIGGYCFYDCVGIKTIFIPKSVTSIGAWSFAKCQITSMIVHEDNMVYDSRDNCNAIIETATNEMVMGCESTIIPQSVTSLGTGCFDGVYFTSKTIDIPESVTTLGSYCFSNSNIKTIVIPDKVSLIGEGCFAWTSIATIVSKNNVPPTLVEPETVFYYVNTLFVQLYVPEQSIGLYSSASGWEQFAIYAIVGSKLHEIDVNNVKQISKYVHNGQIFIEYEGRVYNIFGQPINLLNP